MESYTNDLTEIYNALNTVEVKGYKNAGTLYKCMESLANIIQRMYNEDKEKEKENSKEGG